MRCYDSVAQSSQKKVTSMVEICDCGELGYCGSRVNYLMLSSSLVIVVQLCA